MKLLKSLLVMGVLALTISPAAWSLRARIASEDDVKLLKQDLLAGKIKIGQTRLKTIREVYGDPANITDSRKRLVYDYGNLRIEFDKFKYFRDWEYDYSQEYGVKDEIDDLRFDLEDQQIVGDYYSYDEIVKDYDEPTQVYETFDDGDQSVYYWGELKLTFENFIVVRGWRGVDLAESKTDDLITKDSGVLGTE